MDELVHALDGSILSPVPCASRACTLLDYDRRLLVTAFFDDADMWNDDGAMARGCRTGAIS
jgi:hypothetical protein